MKRKNIILLTIIGILFLFLMLYVVNLAIEPMMMPTKARSLLYTLGECLRHEIETGDPIIIEMMPKAEDEWKTLNDEQHDIVVSKIIKDYNIMECRKGRDISVVDPWGNRFVIRYHKIGKQYSTIIVSKGPDGIYGTNDDIADGDSNKPPGLKQK